MLFGALPSLYVYSLAASSLSPCPVFANTLIHNAGFICLWIFLAEQILHIIAFGRHFLDHPWFVADLVVVSISLAAETATIDLIADTRHEGKVMRVLKAWRLVALIFDAFLEGHEIEELREECQDEDGDKTQ